MQTVNIELLVIDRISIASLLRSSAHSIVIDDDDGVH